MHSASFLIYVTISTQLKKIEKPKMLEDLTKEKFNDRNDKTDHVE